MIEEVDAPGFLHLCSVKKFLIIQTAFLGDVVLATAVGEKLHHFIPEASIDFLLRQGIEGLFAGHPYYRDILVWDKQYAKYAGLGKLLGYIRKQSYDGVINLQRFASTGLLTAFSGARDRIGFDKNPFSFFFDHRIAHEFREGRHEVARNLDLIAHLTDQETFFRPRLYPRPQDYEKVASYGGTPYYCMAPTSVWYTKQYPADQWVSLLDRLDSGYPVYLIGGAGDFQVCEAIRIQSRHEPIINLAAKLNLLETAALMQGAQMNLTNDSAPLHIASAMNAPVTAIFCSTLPSFGYGPLSTNSRIVETKEYLECRPCGLHGRKACPQGHFRCARSITDQQILEALK